MVRYFGSGEADSARKSTRSKRRALRGPGGRTPSPRTNSLPLGRPPSPSDNLPPPRRGRVGVGGTLGDRYRSPAPHRSQLTAVRNRSGFLDSSSWAVGLPSRRRADARVTNFGW